MGPKALLAAAVCGAMLLAGCQKPAADGPMLAASAAPVAPAASPLAPGAGGLRCKRFPREAEPGALAGRVLPVAAIGDIDLSPGEVVLTFDDGPIPGKTERILETLDRFGVSATFMMVGVMARSYPDLVRKVAARGHTIGSHTDRHPNLARMSRTAALAEVARGEQAIAAALSGSGFRRAPFFRFPYLADTPELRAAMARRGSVVLDVDVDSKDYYRTGPDKVLARTLSRLKARGRGIILFHDIHERTVRMLPRFLRALKADGYRVVHLVPKDRGACPAPAL